MRNRIGVKAVVVSLTAGALVGMTATGVAAAAGDYSLVAGEILIWPAEQYGSRMAVIRGDDGQLSFVRVTPATTSSIPVGLGTEVKVVAREGNSAREFTALSVHARQERESDGWRIVTGRVGAVSDSTLVLDVAGGRWAVDLSAFGSPTPPLAPGETITVVGFPHNGRLRAHGLARDTSAPSALPR